MDYNFWSLKLLLGLTKKVSFPLFVSKYLCTVQRRRGRHSAHPLLCAAVLKIVGLHYLRFLTSAGFLEKEPQAMFLSLFKLFISSVLEVMMVLRRCQSS